MQEVFKRIGEGGSANGRIIRRVTEVQIVLFAHAPTRRCTLNCGHQVDVPRRQRPTVGKLIGCPECE
jgi:hypothetical protein